jgi:hypothetical protein
VLIRQHVREAWVVGEGAGERVAKRFGVVEQRPADLTGGSGDMRRVGRGA